MRMPSCPVARRLLRTWALCCVAALASACTSPYSERASDPPFGDTVRRALQTQTLTPSPTPPPAGVPYSELEPALERQQKAKPPDTATSPGRSNASGSGLMGQ